MQISESDLKTIVELVVKTTLDTLEKRNLISNEKPEKTAYQKTEQLLFNYRGFCRIAEEKKQEIEELRKYGVPKKCGGVSEFVNKGGMPQGIVLPEESVEDAVRSVQRSVQDIVQVISKIDNAMYALRNDPYYKILEMRYFNGRTQEDIALELKCSQQNVSKNKSRLVKELAMRLFPGQVAKEMMN